jgi:hypothetical protein
MFTTFEQRACGRPTRSGSPCKANFSGVGFACKLHTTPEEQALVDAYQNGHRTGYQEGVESGRRSAAMSTEHMERQIADLKAKLDQATRRFRVDGLQAVTVGSYAYLWSGQPDLTVGDRVLLPENYVSRLKHGPGPVEGAVTGLGTTYDGALDRILRRISEP